MAKDKTFQFILAMQDDASRKWDAFTRKVEADRNKIGNMFQGLGGLIAGAFSVAAIKSTIDAFAEQEVASAKLSQALANVGDRSAATRRQMEEFSSQMQRTTIYGDEVVTGVQSMIVAMTGLTGAAVQPLTRATLDLASGLGMDAEAAAKLLTKVVETGQGLSRYGIEIEQTTDKSQRLESVMREVQARFGGFAENEALTAAGRMKQLQNAVGELQEEVGVVFVESLGGIAPGLIKLTEWVGRFIRASIAGIKIFIAGALDAIYYPLSLIEIGMNRLGLTNSKLFQQLSQNAQQLQSRYQNEMVAAFTDMGAASDKAVNSIAKFRDASDEAGQKTNALQQNINDLQAQLNMLTPGTDAYRNKLIELNAAKREYNDLVAQSNIEIGALQRGWNITITGADKLDTSFKKLKNSVSELRLEFVKLKDIPDPFENVEKEVTERMDRIRQIVSAAAFAMRDAFEDVWQGEPGGLKAFLKKIATAIYKVVEYQVISAQISAMVQDIIFFGLAGLRNLPKLIAITAGLTALGSMIQKFHAGGTVPGGSGGTYINAPASREFPILVRGGETVRTEQQEAELQRGGGVVNLTINFNAPVDSVNWVKLAVEEGIKRTGLPVGSYFTNTNKALAFS